MFLSTRGAETNYGTTATSVEQDRRSIPNPALHQFMEFANRLTRCKVGARDGLRRGFDPHPADHSVEGNEFLNVWLVAHNGFTVCFRCRGNELLVEIIS